MQGFSIVRPNVQKNIQIYMSNLFTNVNIRLKALNNFGDPKYIYRTYVIIIPILIETLT